MCFGSGTDYHERTTCITGDRYRGEVALAPRHVGCRRYGPNRTYYPSHYYRRPPCGPFQGYSRYSRRYPPRGVVPGGIGYSYGGHGGRYLGGGRAVMPSPSAMPGRRGILVHNGQIPNGAPPTGVVGGGLGYGYGYGGYGGGYGGGGYYPGVYPMNSHITPLHYGPNISAGTYSRNNLNHPSYPSYGYGYGYGGYGLGYPSYNYYSPYATYGYSSGLYANYYHPYQRSYYYNSGVTAPAYSYAYPTVATGVMPTTTTYTVTNSHVNPVAQPMATTTTAMPATTTYPARGGTRMDIQMENRRVATERGSYNPRNIKPADALPDDPFWCRERTGEWHLRTFYQIENECYPGRWLMDPEHGFLVFHRA